MAKFADTLPLDTRLQMIKTQELQRLRRGVPQSWDEVMLYGWPADPDQRVVFLWSDRACELFEQAGWFLSWDPSQQDPVVLAEPPEDWDD